MTSPDRDPDRQRKVSTAAAEFYRAQFLRRNSPARDYLAQRGLAAAGARDRPWGIGYAPPHWTALTEHLRALGYPDEDLIAAGVTARASTGDLIDVFRHRLMFPIYAGGTPIGFTARTLGIVTDANPKYLNTRETIIFRKGEHLYGLDQQRDRLAAGWTPALVEGPTDVLAIATSYARNGSPGVVAVASCGTSLTEQQFAAIAATDTARANGVIAAFDPDSAGHAAIQRLADVLAPTQPHIRLRAVSWPGDDAGALAATAAGRSQLRYTLARQTQPIAWAITGNIVTTYLQRHPTSIGDPEVQLGLANRIAPRLAAQPSRSDFVAMLDNIERQLRHHLQHRPDGIAAVDGVLRMLAVVLTDNTATRLATANESVSPRGQPATARQTTAPFPQPPHRSPKRPAIPTGESPSNRRHAASL
jgi:DNA primase catalytic core